jgi:hypothetical protein
MMLRAAVFVGICLLLQPGPSQAARIEAAATVAPTVPPTPLKLGKKVRLPAGTQLEVELVAPLSSAASHLGGIRGGIRRHDTYYSHRMFV